MSVCVPAETFALATVAVPLAIVRVCPPIVPVNVGVNEPAMKFTVPSYSRVPAKVTGLGVIVPVFVPPISV